MSAKLLLELEDTAEANRLLNETVALLEKATWHVTAEEANRLEDVIDTLRKAISEL